MLTEYQQQKRDNYIAGLRELLAIYERADELPAAWCGASICIFVSDLETLLRLRALVGCREKDITDDHLGFQRQLSSSVSLHIYVPRADICERVKTGERLVPATTEQIIPAKPEHVEETYEWICPPSLLEIVHEADGEAQQLAATPASAESEGGHNV